MQTEIAAVRENLVMADELERQGVHVKSAFTEKINYLPSTYDPALRDRAFSRAGSQSWEDYRRAFGS